MHTSVFKAPSEYLLEAIAAIQASGSRITDFAQGSVARTWLEGWAALVSQHSLVLEQLRLDSYLVTATGEALDAKAADHGVLRHAAQVSTGSVRITRQDTSTAVTIPAGWGDLNTVPTPGSQSIAFLTTADAVFGIGDAFKIVAAVAVVGGVSGNIAALTPLLPVNPVNGVDTATGITAETTFAGGVDAESDDALRIRVPLEIQGRVKGRRESFLAAALGVPGVESASVLRAGDAIPGGGTVGGGDVIVYYEGVVGLLADVQTACANASELNQNVTVDDTTAVPITVDLTVFAAAGTDTAALQVAVRAAITAVVNATGAGQTLYSAGCIQAVQAIEGLISQTIPWQDLRKTSGVDNTFGNVVMAADEHATINDGAITVTVTLI